MTPKTALEILNEMKALRANKIAFEARIQSDAIQAANRRFEHNKNFWEGPASLLWAMTANKIPFEEMATTIDQHNLSEWTDELMEAFRLAQIE
jgi:hypothetical protein